MILSNGNKYIIIMAICSFIILYIVFKMIDYLSSNKYIIECFENTTNTKTSHTVNLPFNSNYNCQNFCGPTSKCAITGQQCFTDIDCPGCQPPPSTTLTNTNIDVPGNNDAGKLTVGVTPDYSPLTSGYGTQALIVTADMYEKPAQPSFGVNTWINNFNESRQLFNKRYKPNQSPNMPNYPKTYSLTGTFLEDGPLASNSSIL